MKLYKLGFVRREPRENDEGVYIAEAPGLAGCRAWGETAAQALENPLGVATAFIESYQEHGDALPEAVARAVEPSAVGELLVVA